MSHCKSIQQKAAGSFHGRKRKSTADSANCSWESDLRFGSFSTKPLNPKLSAKGRVCSSGKETRIRKRGNQNLPVLIFISCFKPRRAPSCFSNPKTANASDKRRPVIGRTGEEAALRYYFVRNSRSQHGTNQPITAVEAFALGEVSAKRTKRMASFTSE